MSWPVMVGTNQVYLASTVQSQQDWLTRLAAQAADDRWPGRGAGSAVPRGATRHHAKAAADHGREINKMQLQAALRPAQPSTSRHSVLSAPLPRPLLLHTVSP